MDISDTILPQNILSLQRNTLRQQAITVQVTIIQPQKKRTTHSSISYTVKTSCNLAFQTFIDHQKEDF